jgi:hypothetical protein
MLLTCYHHHRTLNKNMRKLARLPRPHAGLTYEKVHGTKIH